MSGSCPTSTVKGWDPREDLISFFRVGCYQCWLVVFCNHATIHFTGITASTELVVVRRHIMAYINNIPKNEMEGAGKMTDTD